MAKFISDENIRLNIIINGNKAQSELFDLEKRTRNLRNTNNELRAAKTKLRLEGKKGTEEYKKLSAEIISNNLVLRKNKARMADLQKQIGITGLTMAQLSKKALVLRLQLKHAIPGGAAEKRYRKELQRIQGRLSELNIKAKVTKLSLSSISRGFNKYIALGASVIGTGTGMVLAAQKLIDINNKLSDAQADVMKTTGLTKKEVDELTKSFGFFITRTSRIDLLKIAEAGGRIGIAKKDIAAFTKEMNKANVALGDTFTGGAEEVATKLGKLKTLFQETRNLGVSKAYNAIGSAINQLGASGKATEIEITDFATGVGALPDAMKPSISEALGLGAAFAESGIQANKSGRAYGIFIRKAATSTAKFAKVMGMSNKEVEDLINTNPTEFFLQFTKSLKGVANTDTAEVLKELGLNADGVNKIVGTASNNIDRFRQLLDISNKSMIEGTSLTNEYNIKNTNLSGILATIGNIIQNKFTGSKIQNYLKGIALGFLDIIKPARDLSQEFFDSEKNVAALESNINPLLLRYDDLKSKSNLTKKEQKELDDIILKVSKDIPTAITQFDKYGKAMNISTTSAKAFIKQQQNLLKVKNSKAIEQATKKLDLQKEALETLNHTYQLGADGVLRYFEAPRGIAPAGQDFLTKATSAQTKTFQAQLKAINDNIDGYTALIKQLKGTQTEEEKAAKAAIIKDEADKKAADAIIKAAEAEKNRLRIKKAIFNKTETEITEWLKKETKRREISLKSGIDKELAQIDEKFRIEIEKAKGHDDKIKELETLRDQEKEDAKLQRIRNFEDRKRELQNQIDLENATTDEEKAILKAQQEFDKQQLELNRLKLNSDQKKELLKLLTQNEVLVISQIRDSFRKKETKALLDSFKKIEKAEKTHAQTRENIANVLTGVLIGLLGKSLGARLAAVAIEGAIQAGLVAISGASAQGNVIASTNTAIAKATAISPLTYGMPWSGAAAAAGLTEIAAIKVGTKSAISKIIGASALKALGTVAAKGFEEGLYPVQRQQDGKIFNATYGGQVTSGLVNQPTIFNAGKNQFLAGEQGASMPEMIIDGAAYKKMNPQIKYALQREIGRIKGFEVGLYPKQTIQQNFTQSSTEGIDNSEMYQELMNMIQQNTEALKDLKESGIIAYMSRDLRNAKLIKDDIDQYETLRNKNKIN